MAARASITASRSRAASTAAISSQAESGCGDLVDLLVEGHRHHAAAALAGVPAAGVLGEDAPHDERGDREKVDAVGELRPALAGELEKGLVDERGRLQGVPGPLAAQLAVGDPLELRVEERKELFERRAVACRPGVEQPGDFARIRRRGCQGSRVYAAPLAGCALDGLPSLDRWD